MRKPIAIALALLCAAQTSAADQPSATPPSLEAQLAEAKAQIAEYDKLLTQSEDLLKKQLPALQAELNGLSKPLIIGESAGSMALADGRKFENVTITAITPTNITIRCGREMASIPWRSLPLYFQVRAAHAVLIEVNKGAAPVAAEPAEPVGENVALSEIHLREVKRSENYVYYSWTARVANPTERPVKLRADITLFDANGFKLDSGSGDDAVVPARSFRILTGDATWPFLQRR